MKRIICILLALAGLLNAQSGVDEEWIQKRSAGLTISQAFHPVSHEPVGTVTSGDRTIDLGETPPVYRHQLRTSEYPVLLGDKHERRTFHIHVRSFQVKPDRAFLEAPLVVSYPRFFHSKTGLEFSGGLVFMRDEAPLAKVGVIIPKVIPAVGEMADLFEWQIQIRVNDGLNDIDPRAKAKPQALGADVVVLMATHPDKIPASAPVVWFKFEKGGTVSLLED